MNFSFVYEQRANQSASENVWRNYECAERLKR